MNIHKSKDEILSERSNRISEIRTFYFNRNFKNFALKLGVSEKYASNLCNNKQVITEKTLEKILKLFPEISRAWLYFGIGEMLIDSNGKSNRLQEASQPIRNADATGSMEEDSKSSLPLIPVEAIAGFPIEDVMGVQLSDCDHYSVPEFAAKGAQFLIRVSGSSMYPKYSNGDVLACRKVEEVTFFQWGKVYVLDTNQGAIVKRLFPDKENDARVICHSDNTENYPDFSLAKEDIRALSIVIGVIRLD